MSSFDSTYIERISYILKKLLKKETISTPTIAEYFGVDRRTIHRDIKNRIQPLFEKSIRYDKSVRLWKADSDLLIGNFYSVEELVLIGIIKNIAKDINPSLHKKTKELFRELHKKVSESIYKQATLEDISTHNSAFLLLQKAIDEHKHVNIVYQGKKREVLALKIALLESYWYFIAHDIVKDVTRTFHLKSIEKIDLLEQSFNPIQYAIIEKLDLAINAWFDPINTIVVILHLDKTAYGVIKRRPLNPTQRVMKEYEDGGVEMEIIITHLMEIVPTIQQWIPHIRVVEPHELKEKISDNLKLFS